CARKETTVVAMDFDCW
nr:immunoglobulin heavy chain junction region [Mus musculus]